MSKVVLLLSSTTTDTNQSTTQRRLVDLMSSLKFDTLQIDGSEPEVKELRDKLFNISGQRGKYPQCFFQHADGSYEFIGTWDEIESLNECESIPKEILEANPSIKTLSKVFKDVAKI